MDPFLNKTTLFTQHQSGEKHGTVYTHNGFGEEKYNRGILVYRNYDRMEEWFDDKGLRHRDFDQPAIDQKSSLFERSSKSWYIHGQLKRDGDKPTTIDGSTKLWQVEGKLHRDGDSPAKITRTEMTWFKNGKKWRDFGLPIRISFLPDPKIDIPQSLEYALDKRRCGFGLFLVLFNEVSEDDLFTLFKLNWREKWNIEDERRHLK